MFQKSCYISSSLSLFVNVTMPFHLVLLGKGLSFVKRPFVTLSILFKYLFFFFFQNLSNFLKNSEWESQQLFTNAVLSLGYLSDNTYLSRRIYDFLCLILISRNFPCSCYQIHVPSNPDSMTHKTSGCALSHSVFYNCPAVLFNAGKKTAACSTQKQQGASLWSPI